MKKTHSEVQELVKARTQDFVDGNASEEVLRASLKALGLKQDDVDYTVDMATLEFFSKSKKQDHEKMRDQASMDWINSYLKR